MTKAAHLNGLLPFLHNEMNLTKNYLPSTVNVGGSSYQIKTDFKIWLRFAINLSKGEINKLEDIYFLFPSGKVTTEKPQELIKALIDFLHPKKELPRPIGGSSDIIVMDYEKDADLIYSAFMEQYGIDLMSESINLHWHKFKALEAGLHNTRLNDVMGYRTYNPDEKSDYKKTMADLKRAWKIDRVTAETAEEKAALEKFDALFK